MSHSAHKYCPRCGTAIPPTRDFCESCATQIEKPASSAESHSDPVHFSPPPQTHTKTTEFPTLGGELPDSIAAPPVWRAIQVGWNVLMQDIVGGILTTLVFVLVAACIPYVGAIIAFPFLVGFLGWGEMRRRGLPSGCRALFTLTQRNMWSASVWFLTLVGLTVGLFFLLLILCMGRTLGIGPVGADPELGGLLAIVSYFFYGPVIISIGALSGWAIALGRPFGEAFAWAWRRVWKHLFHWWWAGLVLTCLALIGLLPCGIFVLLTVPVAMIAWAEMAAYKGEE